ncbi:MAG: hypothetical protein Q8N10_13520 [Phenylobacterium sp.]|uniref:GFA family protein n=1 Tax=Phenylobacterium sp. TaxID=1871053 RepID=UPI0027177DB8|nr:hypothetical protein [Phenylobacterium sp.]MDO8914181.1 hypothetical protein [Phenylobacterium sp.]MDP3101504.1 hypothetical protein [Phenylobacterium sp.]
MVRAACHCGAVRITLEPAPAWVLDCNCSICRRYGVLWAYRSDPIGKTELSVELVQGEDAVEAYIWGNRWIGFWRCKACGCVTHHTALDQPSTIRAVNARMFVNFDPASVILHRSDNAHTGAFWTRPDAPIRKGGQPPMDPPRPDDWR